MERVRMHDIALVLAHLRCLLQAEALPDGSNKEEASADTRVGANKASIDASLVASRDPSRFVHSVEQAVV